jgi:sigma-E factor negative regulatory protein RseB
VRALALALVAACGLAQAQTGQTSGEALDLLQRIHQATQRLSYTGTFVYQQGGRSETSRIARIADATGGIERLEVLDGVPREVVRTREGVRCYLPDTQTVKIERANAQQRDFPSVLPDRLSDLTQHYAITRGGNARIAGFDCEAVVLTSRDDLRYGYVLWADVQTGMLLRARTVNQKGEIIEQFTFTQLQIGPVARDKVKSKHVTKNWRIEDSAAAPANLAQAGWTVHADLPGFRKIGEVRRKRESVQVGQIVYSDGLAAVSVFIEPLAENREAVRTGLSSVGPTHIYTREVANHLVTVVGETPAASVRRIADRVEYRRPQ